MTTPVSRTRQDAQEEVWQTVETRLTSADSLLATDKYSRRSVDALSQLTSTNVPLSARLTYLPEPACETFDFSLHCLQFDLNHALLMDYGTLHALFGTPDSTSPKVLTYLDAYACLPWPAHTPEMLTRFNAVQCLLEGFKATKDAIMARASDSPEGKLNACPILLAYQRLLFYRARAQGTSSATVENEIRTVRTFLSVPQEFEAVRVASVVLAQTKGEIEQLYATSSKCLDSAPEAVCKAQGNIENLEGVREYARRVRQSAVWFEEELGFQRQVEEEEERRAHRGKGKRTKLFDRLRKFFSPLHKRNFVRK